MSTRFRLTLAQLNPTVGDIAGNAAKAREAWAQGVAAGADMVMLPEMFLVGYQTQDLILKGAFERDTQAALVELAAACADGPMLGIGGPLREGDKLHNAYYILKGGKVHATTRKYFLPNFNVFDEVRLFSRADLQGPWDAGPLRIGTPICEDAWYPDVCEAMAIMQRPCVERWSREALGQLRATPWAWKARPRGSAPRPSRTWSRCPHHRLRRRGRRPAR